MNTRIFYLFRFVGVPAIGLVFNFVTYFTTPPQIIAETRAEVGWVVNDLLGAVITIIDALLLSEGCLLIYRWLDRRLPWDKSPAKRVWAQLAAHTTYSVIMTVIVYLVFGTCVAFTLRYPEQALKRELADYAFMLYQTVFDATIISLLIVAVYTGFALFQRWQAATLEAEELKRSHLLAQVEALRTQLDPHFLFNNLNTLTALIEDEPRQAVRFVEKLSEVYRYVLQARERETVTLAEEIEFVQAYIFLAKMRFGENLHVTIDVTADAPSVAQHSLIPPMALQLLVENAMKHNVISRERPLRLSITVDEGWVVVTNPLQPRSSVGAESLGIGLKNLTRRYAMLTDTQPIITQTSSEAAPAFVVQLPLLPAPALHHSPSQLVQPPSTEYANSDY
jgi:hypothetical protein